MTTSSVTARFIECYDLIRSTGQVRSARQFAQTLDFYPQSWNDMLKGRRKVTIQIIEAAVERYGFSADYIFTGQGAKLRSAIGSDGLRVLTVVTDAEGRENIVHVPEKAQAGYVVKAASLEAMSEMMSYTIPDMDQRFRSFRSFEVCGDSMQPTLEHGDVVVCYYVEPTYWSKQIKEDQVYVVVTNEDVVVKRVKNRMADQQALHLHSDNITYEPQLVHADRVKELWCVERVIRQFDHKPPLSKYQDGAIELDEIRRILGRLEIAR